MKAIWHSRLQIKSLKYDYFEAMNCDAHNVLNLVQGYEQNKMGYIGDF